jgi:hypothetical protein
MPLAASASSLPLPCVRLPRISADERPESCSNGTCQGCQWRRLVLSEVQRDPSMKAAVCSVSSTSVRPPQHHGSLARRRRDMKQQKGEQSTLRVAGNPRVEREKNRRKEASTRNLGKIAREIGRFAAAGRQVPASLWLAYDRANQKDEQDTEVLNRKAGEALAARGWHARGGCNKKGATSDTGTSNRSRLKTGKGLSCTFGGGHVPAPCHEEEVAPVHTTNSSGKARCAWTADEKRALNELYWEMGGAYGLSRKELLDAYVARFCAMYPKRTKLEVRRRAGFMSQHRRFKEPFEEDMWKSLRPTTGAELASSGSKKISTTTQPRVKSRESTAETPRREGEEDSIAATLSQPPDNKVEKEGSGASTSSSPPLCMAYKEEVVEREDLRPKFPGSTGGVPFAKWERGSNVFRLRRHLQPPT